MAKVFYLQQKLEKGGGGGEKSQAEGRKESSGQFRYFIRGKGGRSFRMTV
jgi:hypothetical protein